MNIELSSQFEQTICSIHGLKGKQWLLNLPRLIEKLAKRWQLVELKPVPNLSYNYVLSGWQQEMPIILKLSVEQTELTREVNALHAFKAYGAVTVLVKESGAVLLQRVLSGYSLKQSASSSTIPSIEIACAVMQKLHQAPLPQITLFPHILDLLSSLDNAWDLPGQYLQKARQLKQLLINTQPTYVLLHGDLHHNNIIANGSNWNVIDPKGIIGWPINEVWAFVMDIAKDTQYVSDYFNFDVTTVRQWYFVQVMLAACHALQDKESPELFLNLAKQAFLML